jgi:glyoxylase-like metal-dependent hydrolase (beta-lactamase superfamily II)
MTIPYRRYFFDVPLTQDMLAAMPMPHRLPKEVDKVINTHHNGDHCNGNCCCPDAEIIAHKLTAEHMAGRAAGNDGRLFGGRARAWATSANI